jgi:hypothetical protein
VEGLEAQKFFFDALLEHDVCGVFGSFDEVRSCLEALKSFSARDNDILEA